MRERAIEQHIELETDLACGKRQLLIDRIQAETVITNLVGNAMESVRAATAAVRRIQVRPAYWIRMGKAIDYSTRTGFSPEIANRLFEPFATTRPPGTAWTRDEPIYDRITGGKLWRKPVPPAALFSALLSICDLKDRYR